MRHCVCKRGALIFALSSEAVFVTLMLAASLGGCASYRFEPDPEVAPSGSVDRVWMPPSTRLVDQEASKLQDLRSFEAKGALQSPAVQEYDLPALLDLALR